MQFPHNDYYEIDHNYITKTDNFSGLLSGSLAWQLHSKITLVITLVIVNNTCPLFKQYGSL